MTNPSQLIPQLVSFLAPFLPYLLKMGEQAAGVTVAASGSRSVAVGGDVTDSVIVTGDGNTVRKG